MSTTQLQFSNRYSIATLQLAPHTTTMRRTKLRSTSRHLVASGMRALFATSVLDTKFRTRDCCLLETVIKSVRKQAEDLETQDKELANESASTRPNEMGGGELIIVESGAEDAVIAAPCLLAIGGHDKPQPRG